MTSLYDELGGAPDAVVGRLADTLKELGVDDEKIARVGAIAESVRGDVLGPVV